MIVLGCHYRCLEHKKENLNGFLPGLHQEMRPFVRARLCEISIQLINQFFLLFRALIQW